MVTLRRANARLFRLLLTMVLTALSPAAALAGEGSDAIPANAHEKRFGAGWQCDLGYREFDGACVAIEVPANAYMSFHGDAWECDRGYRAEKNTCVPVVVPENAHLDYSGNGWDCDRPYQKLRDDCTLL